MKKSNTIPDKLEFMHIQDEIFLSLRYVSKQILKLNGDKDELIHFVLKTKREFEKVNRLLDECKFFSGDFELFTRDLIAHIEKEIPEYDSERRLYTAWQTMTDYIETEIKQQDIYEASRIFSLYAPTVLYFMNLYNDKQSFSYH